MIKEKEKAIREKGKVKKGKEKVKGDFKEIVTIVANLVTQQGNAEHQNLSTS